jgi:hypothetical protein
MHVLVEAMDREERSELPEEVHRTRDYDDLDPRRALVIAAVNEPVLINMLVVARA